MDSIKRDFMLRNSGLVVMLMALAFGTASAQRPQKFHRLLPPGNYSGVTPLGDNRFALVSDKSETDGFFVVRMEIDTIKGRIARMENEGFRSSGLPNRDVEAVCFFPPEKTIFIAGEKDNEVYEYHLDGQRTGRRLQMPEIFKNADPNYGIEALTYDSLRHRFFLTSERPLKGDSLLRIQTFDDQLQPSRQYFYRADKPISRKYFHGVAELCALGDGRLLALERQIRVPKLKIGAQTVIRIYEVTPADSALLEKRLVREFSTRINLVSRRFANYEGLCQPFPGWLLLVADSQNRHKKLLRDWFLLMRLQDKR